MLNGLQDCGAMTRTNMQSELVPVIYIQQRFLVKYSAIAWLIRIEYEPGSVALIFMSRSATGVELFRIQTFVINSKLYI